MAAADVSSTPLSQHHSASQASRSHEHSRDHHGEEGDERARGNENGQQEDEDDYLFSCRCESAKPVSTLLSCLTTHHDKKNNSSIVPVTVFCTPTALSFHMFGTTARQSQVSVDISKNVFYEFHVREGEFCVNLNSVLDCLHVLGNNLERTKLAWTFSPHDQVLEMELLDETTGVLSQAAIPGLVPPQQPSESLAIAFSQSDIVSRVLLKSEWLRHALSELEYVPGATTCTVAVTKQSLQLATVGNVGECVVTLPAIPANQGTALLTLECNADTPRTYPWSSFRLGMRGLDIAEETCVTINAAGMMAIQHQVLDDDGQSNFVDFLMACLEDDDEEEDKEETTQPGGTQVSLGWNSKASTQDEQEHSSSDDDKEDLVRPISAAPLFGTVVATSPAASTSRSVRRRRPASSRTISSNEDDDFQHDNDDDEPLDITAHSRRGRSDRTRHDRDDGASSPELVYGDDE